jgi:peptidoglycan/xylan/chitin deacetylase (PgdA/CDA1 family)
LPPLTRRVFVTATGALSVGVFGGAARSRIDWPDGKRAAVSLTYDDGLDSQLDNAAPQLDAHHLKATFFLTKENMEARQDQWIALSKQGHEVADHTVTHPCKLKPYSPERFLKEEIAPTEAYLAADFASPPPHAFAYPCGFVKLGQGSTAEREHAYETVVRPNFYAARTVDGPPNDPADVTAQRYFLNGFEPTYDHDDIHGAVAYVAKAVARGHWAILIFHEVLPARLGEGDTSMAVHSAVLDLMISQPVWCAPMREVFNHIVATA